MHVDTPSQTQQVHPREPSRGLLKVIVIATVGAALTMAITVAVIFQPPRVSATSGTVEVEDVKASWEILATITSMVDAAVKGEPDFVVRHIDTTSVVNATVDEFYSDTSLHALLLRYTPNRAGADKERVKIRARELVQEELPEHIKSGTLPKRIEIPLPARTVSGLVASTYARNSVKSIELDGDEAVVTAEAPYGDRMVRVKIRFERVDGEWRVIRVENLAEVAQAAGF